MSVPASVDIPPFEVVVETHQREILAYLWRVLGNGAEAEDVFQETFLRAHRAYARLPPDANRRAWLYRIATNAARTHLRRRAHAAVAALDGLEVAQSDEAEQLERRELIAAIRRFVDSLPRQQRLALLLRKFQGLEYEAIGATLGCSAEAARANVYQALKKLRQVFAEEVRDG